MCVFDQLSFVKLYDFNLFHSLQPNLKPPFLNTSHQFDEIGIFLWIWSQNEFLNLHGGLPKFRMTFANILNHHF